MTGLELDRQDLVVLARSEHLSIVKLELILGGHWRGVSLETVSRIRSRAEELAAKAPPSRRIRRAERRDFGRVLDELDGQEGR